MTKQQKTALFMLLQTFTMGKMSLGIFYQIMVAIIDAGDQLEKLSTLINETED